MAWLLPGLATALVLVLARCVVLLVVSHAVHGVPAERFVLRLAHGLRLDVSLALAVGLGAALASAVAARVPAGSASGRWTRAAVVLAAAGSAWALVTGRWGSGAPAPPGLEAETAGGLAATLAVGAGALALAALLVRRASRSRSEPVGRGRLAPAAGLLLVLLLLPPAARRLALALRSPLRLTEVVLDVPITEGAWRTVAASAGGSGATDGAVLAPRAGMLNPSPLYELDGAGMRSLLVPPGTGVELEAPEHEGPLWLLTRAGYGPHMVRGVERRNQPAVARFRVEVDGEEVWRREVPVFGRMREGASEWIDVGGEDGLPLSPGSRVRLSTELLAARGGPYPWQLVADAGTQPDRATMLGNIGFGGVLLVGRRDVERALSSPAAPSVVLVLMDTLRADRLSTYGYGRPTSPRLDALAARGLVVERAYAPSSWTWPSTASVLTGRLPEEHGVLSNKACFLEHGYDTLAEAFARQGMSTAAFSGNPLIVPDKNFDQGFEVFQHGGSEIRESSEVLPGALEWIERHAGERFFAYIHLMDPHGPLLPLPGARALLAPDVPPGLSSALYEQIHGRTLAGAGRDAEGNLDLDAISTPEQRRWLGDLYDACVRSGDVRLGQVLDALERLGIADETIVAFTSDHGEELFDHGFVTHGHSLHQELVRVPLVLAGPGVPAGARLDEPVSNRHLAPTLARLAGADLEGGYESLDLLELLRGGGAEDLLLFHTSSGWWGGHHPTQIHALQSNGRALHWAPWAGSWGQDRPPAGGTWRLYDLRVDPDELHDVAAEHPELTEALQRRLGELRLELSARRVAAEGLGVGEDTLRMLRAIGYLDDE